MKSPKREGSKRGSRGSGGLIWMPVAMLLLFVFSANAQSDVDLKPIGGSIQASGSWDGPGLGGSPFRARCPEGEVLTGFDLWTGDQVDAIRPICIPATSGQFQQYPGRFGGNGGVGPQQLDCPDDTPVVIAMEVASGGNFIVRNIHLFCGQAVATPQRTPFPLAVYDGPAYREECNVFGCRADGSKSGMLSCPTGLVGVGIIGRSGKFLDALGLICGPPPLAPPVVATEAPGVKPQGRIKLPGGAEKPPLPICEAARLAQLRNSPAAPGLDAKCRASGTAEMPTVPIELAAPDFAGDWFSFVEGVAHYITLNQQGGAVKGTYQADDGSAGRIAGNISGNVLRFAWSQADGIAGSGKFTLSGDGQSFKGSYNFGNNPDEVEGSWNGSR